jgi:hypothetical protein
MNIRIAGRQQRPFSFFHRKPIICLKRPLLLDAGWRLNNAQSCWKNMSLFKKISKLFTANVDGKQDQESVVILRNERTPKDSRYLDATFSSEGDIVIHGIDWGAEVARIWGDSEYEWFWTIRAKELPALKTALQVENNLLGVFKMNFSDENAANLSSFLDQHGINYEFWSRMGE